MNKLENIFLISKLQSLQNIDVMFIHQGSFKIFFSFKVSLKSLRPFTSPTLNCESTDENDENEKIAEDHDGVHDTITSLAGAEMLQRYRRAMSGSGSHKDSSSSISQVGYGINKC